ncbi:hypothetical protein pdam_00013514, partial [Pocillopora damicornis]
MTRELTSTYKCGRPCCGTIFVLKSCIKKFFNPGKNERPLSVKDLKFLKILGDKIHKQENKYYEMLLPLRLEVEHPNNSLP